MSFIHPIVLWIDLLLALLAIATNWFIKVQLEKEFDTKQGVYQILVFDVKVSAMASFFTLGWILAFILDFTAWWMCVFFNSCHYPAFLTSVACGLLVSFVRNWNIRVRVRNQAPMEDGTIAIWLKCIVISSFGYFLALHWAHYDLNAKWSSMLEACLDPSVMHVLYKGSDLFLSLPIVSVCLSACILDLDSFLFLRRKVGDLPGAQHVANFNSIPFKVTIVSALWLIPQGIVGFWLGTMTGNQDLKVEIFTFYYRVTNLIRCPILYYLTLAHKQNLISEADPGPTQVSTITMH